MAEHSYLNSMTPISQPFWIQIHFTWICPGIFRHLLPACLAQCPPFWTQFCLLWPQIFPYYFELPWGGWKINIVSCQNTTVDWKKFDLTWHFLWWRKQFTNVQDKPIVSYSQWKTAGHIFYHLIYGVLLSFLHFLLTKVFWKFNMAEFSCMLLVTIHLTDERKWQHDVPALLKNVECSCPRRQSNNLEMGQAMINSNNINTFTNLRENHIWFGTWKSLCKSKTVCLKHKN